MRHMITFPFRLLFYTATTALKIIGFMIGFGFRTLRFATGRTFTVLFAALIGLFLGRAYLGEKLFSDKRR
jgi:hypothetical protein